MTNYQDQIQDKTGLPLKTIIKIGVGILSAVIIIWLLAGWNGTINEDNMLRNEYAQKFDNRTALFDKMWKTFTQKYKIAGKNDTAFQTIVKLQMAGQADGENLAMKWITQANPSATFDKVQELYKDLSRTIEAGRDEFFDQEKDLRRVKTQEDNLRTGTLMGRIFLSGRKPLEYKAITSTRTENAIQSGKDDNVDF